MTATELIRLSHEIVREMGIAEVEEYTISWRWHKVRSIIAKAIAQDKPPRKQAITLKLLGFVSGAEYASQLGVTRQAVNKSPTLYASAFVLNRRKYYHSLK